MSEKQADQFWAYSVAKEIVKAEKKIYVCEGMWTPSGFFHIGNARPEIFTPYAVFLALGELGYPVRQNFIVDDFDAVRKIPQGIGVKQHDEGNFLGYSCATAPSPVAGYRSWADFFVSDVREHIAEFGVGLNIISAYQSYKDGKFNDLIHFSLEHSKEIVSVWNRVAGAEKAADFFPVQVVCGGCKKIYFTQAMQWDGKFVHYKCAMCGFSGKVLPKDGRVKLHWRVHWVCHWIVHDVSFESGGKDHFSKGGSVEVGRALLAEVFKRPPIFQVPTEFIQLKGAKMSGSVGNVISLGDWLEIASPELFRFLNFSTRPNSVIEINLEGNNFLLLDERYNRAARIFFGKENAENEKLQEQISRAYRQSIIGKPPKELPVQVPFSFAVLIAQLFDPEKGKKIEELLLQTGHVEEKLSKEDSAFLALRLLRVRNWVEKFAPQEFRVKFLESAKDVDIKKISPVVKNVFSAVAVAVGKAKNAEELQGEIFAIAKNNLVEPKELFLALYNAFLGRDRGPKLGSLVFAVGKEKIIKRLEELV